ncbi:MAG: glucose-6-phosphate dehydrogenase [Simkaniaceae bacterium]|nr:glucose-6-phosphate dehydrogenase [Simkaniaceae bacterium]
MPLFDHPLEEPTQTGRTFDPCILVIFGATGDLTAKKLLPALYNLKREELLPTNFACVGFARRFKTDALFRSEMKEAVGKHSRILPVEESVWQVFAHHLFYHRSEFTDDAGYISLLGYLRRLDNRYGTKGNRIFYLSTQPSYFTDIVERLRRNGLLEEDRTRWCRIIIEKPFGRDYASALALQKTLTCHIPESRLYRIDHYLGKETVQNLLVFRFANAIFENLWNHKYIDHVQFTVAEDIGIGSRGNFYEEQGFVRDVMQNHMMQLLSLIAMEPPGNLSASAIHDEKVKVLEVIRPLKGEELARSAVRGQYERGWVGGENVPGYREEQNVAEDSDVETYAAIKLHIDNRRWDGVPFYLRGGKRLPKRGTKIIVVFKPVPPTLFHGHAPSNHAPDANVLAIRIQPNEGISLKLNCKVPGSDNLLQPVNMDFKYGSFFGTSPPEAYERLICDCIAGDGTLFARQDELFSSWRFFTPLLEYWADKRASPVCGYPAGSRGPEEADRMMRESGRVWRLI